VSNAALLNFEPIAALILGYLILGQSVAPLQIVGAFIVIGAIVSLGLAKRS
jgi:drug/metabolite transporter (DMT)-like permease